MNNAIIKALEGIITILQNLIAMLEKTTIKPPVPANPHGTQPVNPAPIHGQPNSAPVHGGASPAIPAEPVVDNPGTPDRFEDDFSQYKLGQNLSGVNGYDNAGRTNIAKLGSGQAMQMTILRRDSGGGFGEWGFTRKVKPIGRGQTIRFTGLFFLEPGFQWSTSGAQLTKFMRFKRTQGDYIDLSISQNLDRMRVIVETENIWSQLPKGSLPPTGRLVEIVFEARLDNVSVDKGGMSEISVKMDGQLLRRITNLTTLINAGDKVTDFYMFTYWNDRVPQDQSVYLDSFVLENN